MNPSGDFPAKPGDSPHRASRRAIELPWLSINATHGHNAADLVGDGPGRCTAGHSSSPLDGLSVPASRHASTARWSTSRGAGDVVPAKVVQLMQTRATTLPGVTWPGHETRRCTRNTPFRSLGSMLEGNSRAARWRHSSSSRRLRTSDFTSVRRWARVEDRTCSAISRTPPCSMERLRSGLRAPVTHRRRITRHAMRPSSQATAPLESM